MQGTAEACAVVSCSSVGCRFDVMQHPVQWYWTSYQDDWTREDCQEAFPASPFEVPGTAAGNRGEQWVGLEDEERAVSERMRAEVTTPAFVSRCWCNGVAQVLQGMCRTGVHNSAIF